MSPSSSTPRRAPLVLGAALGALAILALWLSVRSAARDEVLVLPDRAVAGPIRLIAAPWSTSRTLPVSWKRSTEHALSFGEGSRWPLAIECSLRLDPATLGDEGRRWLLDGEAAALTAQIDTALAAAKSSLSLRDVLARPASLAAVLRAPVREKLPRGIELTGLKAAIVATPEQARALAQTALPPLIKPPLARVLYIGLDGADWEQILPLVQRGELPAFERMLREGVRAELSSYEPMISPLLWTTALTGRTPDAHGINDFTAVDAAGEHVPITTGFRKVPALWEILASQQQASGFVGFWATHPAESFGGVLVSDIAAAQLCEGAAPRRPLAPGTVSPPDTLDAIWPALLTTSTVPDAVVAPLAPRIDTAQWTRARQFWLDKEAQRAWKEANKKGRRRPPDAFLLRLAAELQNVETITSALLDRRELAVVGSYFEAIDLAGHYYQHVAPPPHPLASAEEQALFGETVAAVYRLQDRALGRLLERAGPDTIVIVHSDHGFASGGRRPREVAPFTEGQPVEWHRHTGMFLAMGPGIRRGVAIGPVTLYDIAPTLLALRGLPASDAMPGSVRGEMLLPESAARLTAGRVPSWDLLVAPRQTGEDEGELSAEAQEQLMETLRGLGYVSDAPAKPRGARRASGSDAVGEAAAGLLPSVNYYRNLATWFMNESRFEEAEETLIAAIELEPLPKSYWLLSESRAARGDLAGAVTALEQGFAALPDKMTPANLVWLIELHLKRGDVDAAVKVLATYRGLASDSPSTLSLADGLIAHAKGDKSAARAAYRQALQANPREVRAAERLADLAESAEQRAELRPLLEQALAQDPRIEQYWKMLGLLLLEQGDQAGALQALRSAAELDPRDHAVRLAEAQLAARLGQTGAALASLESLARDNSELPQVWLNLGSLRARAGNWRGARDAWRQAQRLGSDSPQLQQAIADAERRL